LESSEDLAVSLDAECLQRLGSMAHGAGVSLDELVNGILREALSQLEEQRES